MAIKGFYNTSTNRPPQKTGCLSLHWKKSLNVELWEGAPLPEYLQQYAVERCWIKVICSTGTWYLCAVYMPTEGGNNENFAKYANILHILDYDLEALKDIKAPSILYGDFNDHIGNASTRHWLNGYAEKVGRNGQLLHDWINKWGKVVVTNHSITTGM